MPNVAINEFVAPSEKTINFLYRGLLTFCPEIATPVFDLPRGTYGSTESWGGFDRSEFLEFVFDITAPYRLTTDLEEAARIIKDWKEGGYPERTIPAELDQLVADLNEDIETKASPYEIREKVKKTQLLAKQAQEQGVKLPPGSAVIIPPPKTKPQQVPSIYIEPVDKRPQKEELDRLGRLLSERLKESAKTPDGLEKEKEALRNEVLKAAQSNLPRVFDQVPPSQLNTVVDTVVEETIERLTNEPRTPLASNPQVLAPLASSENLMGLVPNPELRQRIAKTAVATKELLEAKNKIAIILIGSVLGPKTAERLFPLQPEQYRVTSAPTENTVLEVKPEDFVNNPPKPSFLPDLTPKESTTQPATETAPIETKPAAPIPEETILPTEPAKETEVIEPIPEKEAVEKEPVVSPLPTVSVPISSTAPAPIVTSSSGETAPSEKTVSFLYNGLLALYPETATEAFGLPTSYQYQSQGSWGGFGKGEFSDFVCNVTGTSNLHEAAIVIKNWHEGRALDRTIPVNIDELVAELDEMNAKKASVSEIQALTRAAIARSQRLQEKWQPIPPTTKAAEKPEVPIYLEPLKPLPTPEFTEDELNILQGGMALQQPEQYVVDLTETIIDRVNKTAPEYIGKMTPSELKAFSEALATRTAQVLRGEYKSLEPSHWALAALANPNDPLLAKLFPDPQARLKFVEAIQGRAFALEATDVLERDFLYRVFGKEIGAKLLGPEGPIIYTASLTKTENSEFEVLPEQFLQAHKVYLEKIRLYREAAANGDQDEIQQSIYRNLYPFRSTVSWSKETKGVLPVGLFKTRTAAVGAIAGYRATMNLTSIWGSNGVPLVPLAGGGFLNVVTTSAGTRMIVTQFVKFVDLNLGPVGFLQVGFGHIGIGTVSPELAGRAIQGIAGQAGKPAVAITAKVGGKLISAISTKLGALLAKIGAIFGTSAPVVGTILWSAIGAVAGKVIEKVVKLIQEHKQTFAAIMFSPVILVGIIFGVPVLTIVGGIGVGVSLAGGVGKFATSAANFTMGFIKGITAMSMASIGTPLLITIISFPVLVAIILFIINSGAYLVPPKTGFEPGVVVSQYIDITKTASPTGPFANSDLPKTIEYTVTIRAKKSTLSDIRISDLCDTVSRKSKPNCPAPNPPLPKEGDANYPDTITPSGNGFSFKYQKTFTSPNFDDTLVSDTITVVADVPEKQDDMASSGVSVKFGNPPEECPNGWPILPEVGESHLNITQGPLGTYSHSKAKLEAIDIGATIGHTITARHSGVVKVHADDIGSYGPKYVDIISSCNGNSFLSRYAHLSAVSVITGQSVTLGQKIGYSGASSGNQAHLHYEFRGLKMTPKCTNDVSYRCIPKSVPYGCSSESGICGTVP